MKKLLSMEKSTEIPKKLSNNPKLLNLILSSLFSHLKIPSRCVSFMLHTKFSDNSQIRSSSSHSHLSYHDTPPQQLFLKKQHKLGGAHLAFIFIDMKVIREFSFSNFYSCVCCFLSFLDCDCLPFFLITKFFLLSLLVHFLFLFVFWLDWVEFYFVFFSRHLR